MFGFVLYNGHLQVTWQLESCVTFHHVHICLEPHDVCCGVQSRWQEVGFMKTHHTWRVPANTRTPPGSWTRLEKNECWWKSGTAEHLWWSNHRQVLSAPRCFQHEWGGGVLLLLSHLLNYQRITDMKTEPRHSKWRLRLRRPELHVHMQWWFDLFFRRWSVMWTNCFRSKSGGDRLLIRLFVLWLWFYPASLRRRFPWRRHPLQRSNTVPENNWLLKTDCGVVSPPPHPKRNLNQDSGWVLFFC